jgi:hypothetical protein
LKKINYYIESFKNLGFEVKSIGNKSALFTKETLQFKARVRLRGNLEVYELSSHKNREEIINHLDLFIELKNKDFISHETFIDVVNNIGSEREAEILKLLYTDVRHEIKLNLLNKKKPFINKFKYLLVIIPKSSRAEFIADLQCIISDMKTDDCSKLYINFIILLHIISVAYHAFFFKLKGYFYSNKEQSNKD